MNAKEALELSRKSPNAKTWPNDSYIRFIDGKIKQKASDGKMEITNVFENLSIGLPFPKQLDEIIEHYKSEGYTVDFKNEVSKPKSIVKISWGE